MKRYADCPQVLREFLIYHENIKGQSPLTISEYYLDLRMFLRFIKLMRCDMPIQTSLDEIDIRDVDLYFIRTIDTTDIFDFLSYLANDRVPRNDVPAPEHGISSSARARKLSAIKSFYKYLTVRTKQLEDNPVADLEYPKLRKSLPKYLTLEQSSALLKAVEYEPENADALAYLGYVYLIERNKQLALDTLQKALKIDPNNFLAKNHIAKYYFQEGKYDISMQFLLDIVQTIKDDETLNMLAVCYMEQKEYENAMGIFYKLANKYPQNHILLTNLAKCELKCNKKDEAQEHLRQALMIFDDYQEALDLLEEINCGR